MTLNINGITIAPFKNPNQQPYGGFANTTSAGKYPVSQSESNFNGYSYSLGQTILWPSSEHAYHGQKLLNLMHRYATQQRPQWTKTPPLSFSQSLMLLAGAPKPAKTKEDDEEMQVVSPYNGFN